MANLERAARGAVRFFLGTRRSPDAASEDLLLIAVAVALSIAVVVAVVAD